MAANNEFPWNDQDDQPEYKNKFEETRAGDPDDDFEKDENDETDEFLNDENLDPEYDNLLGDDIAFDRNYDESEGNGFDEDKDFEAHLAPESVDPDPNEIPEKQESEQEGSGYEPRREYSQPQEGNDTSYSEQTDVTPPRQPEVPGGSPAEAYRSSEGHGRTTGRMVGHEPGTEGAV
ncbi:hypothetical protein DJ568_14125 [Mucilaginibacter hurinus]|uniref:Uncharacterized protein n=1 Tax=Mucilaginibacter hurinus TaxID=2201324 RepID=A0A367GMW0_9SPHI|nr:hypothetical protein [Mucilaginibacter hurinus]RCH54021.1 hypothetical protein DJ568_14125 [Mucilaginibacter hurinus]